MEDKEQNILEHLNELRKRIMVSAIAFIVFFCVGFMYVKEIYQWFVRDFDHSVKLIVLGPSDIIWIYFTIATVIAVTATIPILALQIWLFIKPALLPKERKITLSYIPALFVLFIAGLCFGYFVILPTLLNFLVKLGGDLFQANFTAEKYFQFIMNTTLPFGILFELPVVVMFLTSIGIITPAILRKLRKIAYFVLVIIASMITPPDFVSHLSVAIPLLFLYEISISLSSVVYKRKLKKEKEWEETNSIDDSNEMEDTNP